MKLLVCLALIGLVIYPIDIIWHLLRAITRPPG